MSKKKSTIFLTKLLLIAVAVANTVWQIGGFFSQKQERKKAQIVSLKMLEKITLVESKNYYKIKVYLPKRSLIITQAPFINAHLGWMGNDLKRLGDHLDKFPNVVTEFGAVIAELGRQPKTARQFFIDYQDRIMFGKDSYNKEEFYTYFRVLESDDEYFNYFRKRHAFWKMYGLNLPDEVLKKVYYKNALRLFPSIPKELFE